MAPRASAQEAVDLLKIYQLRRENTLIYEKLQNLQQTVLDLTNKQKTAQKSTEKISGETGGIKGSVTKQQNELVRIDTAIQSLQNDHRELQNHVTGWQQREDVELKNMCHKHDELQQIVLQGRDHQQRQWQRVQDKYGGFADEISELQTLLKSKAAVEDVHALNEQIEAVAKLSVVQRQEASPVSRIRDSFDGIPCHEHDQDSVPGNQFDDDKPTEVIDEDATESEQDMDDLCSTKTKPTMIDQHEHNQNKIEKMTMSDVPEDIDLDEATQPADNAACLIPASSPSTSLQSLPRSLPDKVKYLNEILAHRQLDDEDISAYLERCEALRDAAPTMVHETLLCRLAEGVLSSHERTVLREWLDEFGWSWENLQSIIRLRPYEQTADKPRPEHTLRENAETRPGSDIFTIASQSHQTLTTAGARGKWNSHAVEPVHDNKPRRSRRIAELQQKRMTSEAHRIETLADAADQRIGIPATKASTGNKRKRSDTIARAAPAPAKVGKKRKRAVKLEEERKNVNRGNTNQSAIKDQIQPGQSMPQTSRNRRKIVTLNVQVSKDSLKHPPPTQEGAKSKDKLLPSHDEPDIDTVHDILSPRGNVGSSTKNSTPMHSNTVQIEHAKSGQENRPPRQTPFLLAFSSDDEGCLEIFNNWC